MKNIKKISNRDVQRSKPEEYKRQLDGLFDFFVIINLHNSFKE